MRTHDGMAAGDEAPAVHEEGEGPGQVLVEGGMGLREHIARDAGDDGSALVPGETEGDPLGDRDVRRGSRAPQQLDRPEALVSASISYGDPKPQTVIKEGNSCHRRREQARPLEILVILERRVKKKGEHEKQEDKLFVFQRCVPYGCRFPCPYASPDYIACFLCSSFNLYNTSFTIDTLHSTWCCLLSAALHLQTTLCNQRQPSVPEP
jgi:hypothetical protein